MLRRERRGEAVRGSDPGFHPFEEDGAHGEVLVSGRSCGNGGWVGATVYGLGEKASDRGWCMCVSAWGGDAVLGYVGTRVLSVPRRCWSLRRRIQVLLLQVAEPGVLDLNGWTLLKPKVRIK